MHGRGKFYLTPAAGQFTNALSPYTPSSEAHRRISQGRILAERRGRQARRLQTVGERGCNPARGIHRRPWVRWALTFLGAALVSRHVITADQAQRFAEGFSAEIAGAVLVLGPLVWSLMHKWYARVTLAAARSYRQAPPTTPCATACGPAAQAGE